MDKLRALVDALPAGSSITLTRADLVNLLDPDDNPTLAADLDGRDYSVLDLARLLGRGESTIRTWLGRGEIPGAYRIKGKEWRVPRAAWREFLDREAQRHAERAGTRKKGRAA